MPDLEHFGYEPLEAPVATHDGLVLTYRAYAINGEDRLTVSHALSEQYALVAAQEYDRLFAPPKASAPSGGIAIITDDDLARRTLVERDPGAAPYLDTNAGTRRLRD